jgi:hypothetical protein
MKRSIIWLLLIYQGVCFSARFRETLVSHELKGGWWALSPQKQISNITYSKSCLLFPYDTEQQGAMVGRTNQIKQQEPLHPPAEDVTS